MKLFKNSKLLSKLFLFLAIFYASAAFAQKSSRIVGIVKDATGEPAIGVNVAVKGTKQLAITDADGNYVINAPSNGTLVFSYIGFRTCLQLAGTELPSKTKRLFTGAHQFQHP